MKTKQLTTLLLIFLVVMPFVQSQDTPTITINTNIPRYTRSQFLDISGTTAPNATVELFVQALKRRQTTADEQGTFVMNNVLLPETENTILLRAKDAANTTAEQTSQVTVDTHVPNFRILNFSSIIAQPSITITAETDKPLNVSYSARPLGDLLSPDKILNLRKDSIEQQGIRMTWDASPATDLSEYIVYRNNQRIATTTATNYIDQTLTPDTQYDYRVSAIDKNCNEGILSNILSLRSLANTQATTTATEVRLACTPEERTMTVEQTGIFTITVDLTEGENEVNIKATDRAGHSVTYRNITTVDTVIPQIEDNNLAQISPTYIPEIVIEGRVNKKATVFVYINEARKPAEYTVTADDGTFRIPVMLRRDIQRTETTRRVALDTGEGWENNIKLEAVDATGRKTVPVTGRITYALCGFGNWFDVRLGKPLPEKLTPRFILEGIQEVGLLLNATYRGNYNVTVGQVTVNPLLLSQELEGEYDNGLVDVSTIVEAQSPKSLLGYIQVLFRQFTFPDDAKLTIADKEKNISLHRASSQGPRGTSAVAATQYKNCLTPGIGCMKLFLEVQIPFQEKIPKEIIDPRTQKTIERFQLENRVQKTCLPIEIAMDVPIPPKHLPKSFLKKAIEFLDSAVDTIDVVLKPLTTIGTYVLYSCLAMTSVVAWDVAQEMWACEAQEFIGKIGGGGEGAFDKAIATAGLCEAVYDGDAKENCKSCEKHIEDGKKFEDKYYHPICDRVACPSAPTLQSHIRNRAGELEPMNVKKTSETEKWFVGDKIYAGDDCAFGPYAKPDALQKLSLQYESTGKLGIKDIYQSTKEKVKDSKIELDDCKLYTRPAHPACCGISYQREWQTACGPAPLYESFDELKESTCLAAQNVNKKTTDPDLNCGGIFNAAAGFCDPETGGETIDPIPTGIKYLKDEEPAGARTNEVYVIIVPTNLYQRKGGKGTGTDYRVYRGAVTERFTKGETKEKKTAQLGRGIDKDFFEIDVNAKTTVVSDGIDLTKHFDQERSEGKDLTTAITAFETELCTNPVDGTTCNKAKVKQIYERVYERIGVSDKEYIVKPDQEGLLRSFQCVCLPALTSSLQFWRNVLGMTRDCFKSILLTGDGSEGVCKAFLSTYVCDLVFSVVKCFVQKFNAPGYGARPTAGIGDFLGTVTKTGAEVQRRVQGRYGETQLWKTMFVDRQLVHSICAFAFTGKWDFDVSGLFSQTVESIPVQSQGLLLPCTRQFISFSPTTDPKGKTTHVYHFGVGLAAGSDVRYELLLKCSQGFKCDPSVFKNGECDCNKKTEILRSISSPDLGTGTLKKNDILNKELFYTIQANSPEGIVRYDKAILRYTYLDPKSNKEETKDATCDIQQVGSAPPDFCQFDPFSASFRCQFGVGESAVRLDKIEPKYPDTRTIRAFGTGDEVKIDLHVTQQQPIERARTLEGTKYILYTLTNQRQEIIAEVKEDAPVGIELKREGSFVHPLSALKKISEKDFGTTGPTAAGPTFTQLILTPRTPRPQSTNVVGEFSSTKKIPYVIKFKDGKFSVYEGSNAIKDGMFSKNPDPITTGRDLDIRGNIGVPLELQYTVGTEPTTILKIRIDKDPGEDEAEIVVIPPETRTAINPCAKGNEDKAVPWTIDVEIRDADQGGRVSPQISIDPSTGKQAKESATIMVMCSQIPTAAATAATPPIK